MPMVGVSSCLTTGLLGTVLRTQRRAALIGTARLCHSGSTASSPHGDKDKMRVEILPALQDNYMYLLVDNVHKVAAVVDPVQPKKVVDRVKALGDIRLTTVLTTHHHWDHAGGNTELCTLVPGLKVYGGDRRIQSLTDELKGNETFTIGSMNVSALHTPCHTTGHICYSVKSPTPEPDARLEHGAVFTGDTLFIGGCGRFFEGTAKQMQDAMDKLAHLSPHMSVYCGHEYTVANLKFALSVEPQNQKTIARLHSAEISRKLNQPTVPSTIGHELEFNPFMRTRLTSMQEAMGCADCVSTMAKLREDKNNFRGA